MNTAFKYACIIYLPWIFYWAFFEITAYLMGPTGVWRPGLVPWYTLSEFVWEDQSIFHPLKIIFLVGFIALSLHFAGVNLQKFIKFLFF